MAGVGEWDKIWSSEAFTFHHNASEFKFVWREDPVHLMPMMMEDIESASDETRCRLLFIAIGWHASRCVAWLLGRFHPYPLSYPSSTLARALRLLGVSAGSDLPQRVSIVRHLLEAKADPNQAEALQIMSNYYRYPNNEALQLLFEHGALPGHQCATGIFVSHQVYCEARARILRVRTALICCLKMRGWPRDLAQVFHFSTRDPEWQVGLP